jgi:hypothetical protein
MTVAHPVKPAELAAPVRRHPTFGNTPFCRCGRVHGEVQPLLEDAQIAFENLRLLVDRSGRVPLRLIEPHHPRPSLALSDIHGQVLGAHPTVQAKDRGQCRLPIASDAYTVGCMADLYEVKVEPEVRVWLDSLSDRDFGRVDFLVGLLAERAETLGEPYTRHLDGKSAS